MPLLPGPFCSEVIVSVRFSSLGQIGLLSIPVMAYIVSLLFFYRDAFGIK